MEIEPGSRASLDFLPARQRNGYPSRGFEKMSTTAIHSPRHALADVPRYSPSTVALSEVLSCGQQHFGTQGADMLASKGGESYHQEIASNSRSSSTFHFDKDISSKRTFSLPQHNPPPLRGTKRARLTHDVDGPHTSSLCCKKRRLRAELITSRLSQPFSQPATHILNREGADSGDKRFLKMATSVDAIRRIAHLHATSFLRFSIMNRIRRRIGMGRPGLLQQRMCQSVQPPGGGQSREVDATATAPWKPQSLQIASGATYWRPSGTGSPGPSSPTISPQGERSRSPAPKALPPVPRVSKPAALPMPASDLAATQERTAPRIHSVPSPELRADKATYEDTEEDSFAFLHPDFDDCGDDEPEHVYSDFGAIFRPSSPDAATGEDHSYEEYLDELDGISWVTR